ncbi:MAG: NADP-dependent oxidoreductase [Anaerolineae bacterium]|nr:NADP-dependent oxidoreductase [Anaerolineae bacterium]
MPDTMQAVRIHQYGDTDQLQLETIPIPQPQANEVLVRVHAVGVLPADNKTRQGFFKNFRPITFPYTPCSTFAGVIEALGANVTNFKVGQPVFGRTTNGAAAEYITASIATIAPKPDAITFAEAATISGGATTAWSALFDNANLQPDQHVLIHAAAGGVGLFAVQFAHWKGAHVTGTASAANLDFVRSLGAETVIDYNVVPFEDEVHNMDVVLDSVGDDTTSRSMVVLKPDGILVSLLGPPDQAEAQKHGIRAMNNTVITQPYPSTSLLQTIADLMASGTIKTHIAEEFSLADVRLAHQRVDTGHSRGRVILRLT